MMKSFAYIIVVLLCGMLQNCSDPAEKIPRKLDTFPPYQVVLAQIAEQRHHLSVQYHQAPSQSLKREQLAEARNALIHRIEYDLLPQWAGTLWDFNGTTEIPRKGSIACGYFVTTILRDAGFHVQRVRLAQQASELIIKSLTTETHIKRFSHAPIDEFVSVIQKWGAGIYIVGLDMHTGFIVSNREGVFFIHSSYMVPRTVVKEVAQDSVILGKSKYRVLGKISADDTLVLAWLQEKTIPTRTH